VSNTKVRDLLDRPILIVSSPRSGSTLLFETLAQAPGLFTIGSESHGVIERVPGLGPHDRGWDSNRLTAQDLTPQIAGQLPAAFYNALRDRSGTGPDGAARMLEKTPKNALRVPFFRALWPHASFVYLYRDPRPTIASMIRGWQSGRFRTYRLPGWPGPPWSFLLVPGWEEFGGLPLAEIAARQWALTTQTLVNDLSNMSPDQVRVLDYDAFITSPQQQVEALAGSLGLGWDRQLPAALPNSRYTLSSPNPNKWKSLEVEIGAILPLVAEADAVARSGRASDSYAVGVVRG
jgi:hypothetical protein